MKKVDITPYSELDNILRQHAKKIKQILKSNFVGYYLQGSLAIGDFDLTSDIDFIIVINNDLTQAEVNKIQHIHSKFYNQNNRWVKRFEYSFFPINKLGKPSSPFINGQRNDTEERKLWYFDNGSQKIEKSDHCNTLVVRWTLWKKGVVILGPNPKSIFKPVDSNNLRQEIKNTMIGWGKDILINSEVYQNRFYQSYLVLNYTRMLHNLHTGKIGSKREGMIWAKTKLDPAWFDLIDFCWQERQDTTISIKQPVNPEIYKKTLKFVNYIVSLAKKYQQ